jgi:spoIIIJ-associated protein
LVTDDPGSNPKLDEAGAAGRAREVEEFCREAIRLMGMDLGTEVSPSGETILVNLSGPDRSLLLTNAGSVLNSLEYLVNKAFRTSRDAEVPTIMIDSDRYRQHREAELVLLAQMASQRVLEQRRPLSLQPMIPRERRIIHLALASITGVRSQSEGEGENRCITIYPA